MYSHYYDLNNIAKHANSDKARALKNEAYKECTFKPAINQESVMLDYHNISQYMSKFKIS